MSIMHTYYYVDSNNRPNVSVHGCELQYREVAGCPIPDGDARGTWGGRLGLLSFSILCHPVNYSCSLGVYTTYGENASPAFFNIATDNGEPITSPEHAAKVLERESRWLLLVLDGFIQSNDAKRIMGRT